MKENDSFLNPGEIQLEKYWKIIKPRIHIPVFVSFLMVIAAFVQISLRKPAYLASGLLMIEPEKNIINLADNMTFQGFRNEYFNTQIRILTSRSLAKSVEDEIGLTPDNISVEPIEFTHLVQVSAMAKNPETVALVINTLFSKFIEFNLDVKTQSSRQASEFIGKQIRELQQNLAQKEQELQEYGKRKELFYLSKDDSTTVEKFSDLNKAYTQAQIERINRESMFQELRNMKFEDYPEVKKDTLIVNLKSNHSNLESEFKKKAQIFKESYPEMNQLKSQLDALQRRIENEVQDRALKTLNEAKAEYQSAVKKEESLLKLLNEQKGVMINSNANAIYYNSLQIEVENSRTLLDFLLKKQKESLLSSRMEGLQTSNIRVIDQAEVPKFPVSQKKYRTFLLSFFFGLILGLGMIFVLDYLDHTIKTPDEVKSLLGIPTLGVIPSSRQKSLSSYYSFPYHGKKSKDKSLAKDIELINVTTPENPISESYRSIRTSILLSTPKESPKIIALCSAVPSEGKTATAANLAISFSQLGKKVLIMDGDMRKPRMHKIFKITNTVGLSSYLVGRSKISEIIQKTHIPNVFLIPSGPIPPNPAELIDSSLMTKLLEILSEGIDFIFIDTPPLMGIVDPILLGKYSDGIVLVNWAGKTNRNMVLRAIDEVGRFNIRILGIILNKLDFKKHPFNYGYSYYSYQYQYQYRDKPLAATKVAPKSINT